MEQNMSRIEFNEIIKSIGSMNEAEIHEIFSALIKRYSMLFPDNELNCVFLPRNNKKERQQILQQVTDFLLKHSA